MHRLRHVVIPIVGLALFAATLGAEPSTWLGIVLGVVLALCVLEAVHHAEVVAARVGEPFGSLILAVAVTVIEVGLIIALMLNDPDTTGGVARDTVFSATMIACNGIVGGALVLGTWRERLVTFNPEGVGAAVAAIAALAVLSLVLPTFTETTPGPYFSTTQLVFAAVAALAIYLAYVLVQTVRHRDFFLPPTPSTPATSRTPRARRRARRGRASRSWPFRSSRSSASRRPRRHWCRTPPTPQACPSPRSPCPSPSSSCCPSPSRR